MIIEEDSAAKAAHQDDMREHRRELLGLKDRRRLFGWVGFVGFLHLWIIGTMLHAWLPEGFWSSRFTVALRESAPTVALNVWMPAIGIWVWRRQRIAGQNGRILLGLEARLAALGLFVGYAYLVITAMIR